MMVLLSLLDGAKKMTIVFKNNGQMNGSTDMNETPNSVCFYTNLVMF
jgi:hypothetical protein